MGDAEPLVVRTLGAISAVDPTQWDACAGPGNIFESHAFLRALEASGSATPETGWAPHHLVIERPDGEVVGAAPLYLKSHSLGEYVFDHAWADAYERAGGRYYPKLLGAVPFTPVTGPRLLAKGGEITQALLGAAIGIAERLQVSSLHFTFPTEDQWALMGRAGLLQRMDQQFHWLNQGYGDFNDFLATLSSRKRKVIRRERRAAVASGITIEALTGAAITESHWDAFFAFYQDTGARKWGRPYLTREFFSRIGQSLADRILLILCRREGRAVAGALHFIGGEVLHGRYWGCLEDHPFLHFEACYYQAIDYAIAHRLARVEAGAQGPHKLARGYVPRPTYSTHWIRDPNFRDAVARYLEQERRAVADNIKHLAAFTPFKKTRKQ